ncbi:Hypothetical predicted protein [Olea europaea subsp. europaea]|uniref:SHSP domain-containing protein n=1 Tax=Olea europaea subsp. europaea TaxID=158383 RepID=A0A8S0VJX2_OLEEU|nr:Hypothetical predicted protein [Olea europaea subsp. europaea]
MENIVKEDGGNAEKKSSSNIIYEELKPLSDWAEDSDCHCLLVDLPGFNKEQVRVQADHKSYHVKISGERKERENKYIRFEQSYKVPENSNIEETSAKFEDEILYVIIPLKTRESKEGHSISSSSSDDEDDSQSFESSWDTEDLHENNDQSKDNDEGSSYNSENKGVLEEEEFHDTKMEKQSYEGKLLEEVKKRLMKNKKTILTAVLAFSLGILFSQKLQSNGQRMSFE